MFTTYQDEVVFVLMQEFPSFSQSIFFLMLCLNVTDWMEYFNWLNTSKYHTMLLSLKKAKVKTPLDLSRYKTIEKSFFQNKIFPFSLPLLSSCFSSPHLILFCTSIVQVVLWSKHIDIGQFSSLFSCQENKRMFWFINLRFFFHHLSLHHPSFVYRFSPLCPSVWTDLFYFQS